MCASSLDCAQGEVCEDAVCRQAPCGSDSECAEGHQCIGGSCEAPPQTAAVDSCQVLPAVALTKTGTTRAFTVLAKDATGNTLAHKGNVTWSVDQVARGAIADGVLTGGTEAGALQVRAKVGATDCAVASVENFTAPSPGKVRVIVADSHTQRPVSNVKIVFNGEAAVDAATGIHEFDTPAGAFDVHAYPADADGLKYAWVSAYGTTSRDLLLYTKQSLPPARFEGKMSARAFDNLSDLKGTIHLALKGASIAGNLFDVDLATVLGDRVDTEVDLGSRKFEVPLPEGTVLGLGEQMFRGAGDKPFTIVSSAGVRTLWGLGGNAEFSAVTDALGPVISGEDLDLGAVMTKLMPMLGRLQSGALTGVVAEAGKTTNLNGTDGESKLKLDTLLRLRVEASLPDLPTYKTNGEYGAVEVPIEGAIVVGGALYGVQGFVPLGLTAGVDTLPKDAPDGKIDADEVAGTSAGKLALRVAPLHSGMEASNYVMLALATSFTGLLGDADAETPGVALSGLVSFPGALSFDGGKPVEIDLGDSFLDLPDLPGITDRTLSAGSKVDGAAFQRLSVGDAEGGEWHVYFKPGTDVSLTLPTPPEGLSDRFTRIGDEQPRALLHSVRLSDAAITYDEVLGFGSDNLDDLSKKLHAFSTIELKR